VTVTAETVVAEIEADLSTPLPPPAAAVHEEPFVSEALERNCEDGRP
jgi:hypothetical protein